MVSSCILGLDLAEQIGVSVLEVTGPVLRWSDSVKLAHRDAPKRLVALRELLLRVIEKFKPCEIAIEDVFLPAKTSRKTPISLGELRGVARLCAAEQDIPVFFYPPAKVKITITGSGKATKQQVADWIESEFQIKIRDHNEADAIGIAYTHWLSRRFANLSG